MNTRRLTAGLAAVALAPALAFGATQLAQADGGFQTVVAPAHQYDPSVGIPPLVVGDPISITAIGCVKGNPVTIKASVSGIPVKVNPYNAAGGWGTAKNGQDAYTTNAAKMPRVGWLKVSVSCVGEYGPTDWDKWFFVNPVGTEPAESAEGTWENPEAKPTKPTKPTKPAPEKPAKPAKPALPETGN